MTDQELADDIKAQYQITFDAIAQGDGVAEIVDLMGMLDTAYAKAAKVADSWGPKAAAYLSKAAGYADMARSYPGNENRKRGMIKLSRASAILAGDAIPDTTIQSGAC